MFNIYVFGMDLADVEYEFGGWQMYARTSDKSRADEIFSYLEAGHGENVMMCTDDELNRLYSM